MADFDRLTDRRGTDCLKYDSVFTIMQLVEQGKLVSKKSQANALTGIKRIIS